MKEVTYIGHKLTQEGTKPDNENVPAINDMPAPTDKKGVERLFGAFNYLGKFIPNLASVTEPITVLLQKDVEFQWPHEQDKTFQEIKIILIKNGGRTKTCTKACNYQLRCLTHRPRRSVATRWLSCDLCLKIPN